MNHGDFRLMGIITGIWFNDGNILSLGLMFRNGYHRVINYIPGAPTSVKFSGVFAFHVFQETSAFWAISPRPLGSHLELSQRKEFSQADSSMPGPAQLECMRLKVLLRNKEEVRAALRAKGFSASRAAQLLADCEQSPPRNPVQRARQTAQDPPKKIICLPRKKYCNSTNDAPSTIYIYIHMGIDLKVLVRSFNCESRACYDGDPRESFFFDFAKVKFYFAKVSRKLDILIIM